MSSHAIATFREESTQDDEVESIKRKEDDEFESSIVCWINELERQLGTARRMLSRMRSRKREIGAPAKRHRDAEDVKEENKEENKEEEKM
jgi:hypothetical protein